MKALDALVQKFTAAMTQMAAAIQAGGTGGAAAFSSAAAVAARIQQQIQQAPGVTPSAVASSAAPGGAPVGSAFQTAAQTPFGGFAGGGSGARVSAGGFGGGGAFGGGAAPGAAPAPGGGAAPQSQPLQSPLLPPAPADTRGQFATVSALAYGASRAAGQEISYSTDRYMRGGDDPMARAGVTASWISLAIGTTVGIASANPLLGVAAERISNNLLDPMLKALAAPEANRQAAGISLAPFFGSRFGPRGFAEAQEYTGRVIGTGPGADGKNAPNYDVYNSRLSRLVHRTDAGLAPEFRFGDTHNGSGVGNAAPILGAIGGTLFNYGIDPFGPGEMVNDPDVLVPADRGSMTQAGTRGRMEVRLGGGGGAGGGGGQISGGGSGSLFGGNDLFQLPRPAPTDTLVKAPGPKSAGAPVQSPHGFSPWPWPNPPNNLIQRSGPGMTPSGLAISPATPMGEGGGIVQVPGVSAPGPAGAPAAPQMNTVPGGRFQENIMETYFRRTGTLFGKDGAADAWKRMAPGFDPYLGGNSADILGKLGALDTLSWLRVTNPDGSMESPIDPNLLSRTAGSLRSNARRATLGGLRTTGSGRAMMDAFQADMDALGQLPDGKESIAYAEADSKRRSARSTMWHQSDLGDFATEDMHLANERERLDVMPYAPGNLMANSIRSIGNRKKQIARDRSRLKLNDLSEDERFRIDSEAEGLQTENVRDFYSLIDDVPNKLPSMSAGAPGFFSRIDGKAMAAIKFGEIGFPAMRLGARNSTQLGQQRKFMHDLLSDADMDLSDVAPSSRTENLNHSMRGGGGSGGSGSSGGGTAAIEALLRELISAVRGGGGAGGGRMPGKPGEVAGRVAGELYGKGDAIGFDRRFVLGGQ